MPMNLEYVIAAYGIWLIAFIIYIPVLRRRLKVYTHALETYKQKKKI